MVKISTSITNRFLTPDSIVPDPADPQQFNRYSYVYNNPVGFIDPTGHFTVDAIYNYIYDNECNKDVECADTIMKSWQNDEHFWNMLLLSNADDIAIVGEKRGDSVNGAFYTFAGVGNDVLNGIYRSDVSGKRIKYDSNNVSHLKKSSNVWFGNIRCIPRQNGTPELTTIHRDESINHEGIGSMTSSEAFVLKFLFGKLMSRGGDPGFWHLSGSAGKFNELNRFLTFTTKDQKHVLAIELVVKAVPEGSTNLRYVLGDGFYRYDTGEAGPVPYFRYLQGEIE